MATITRSSMSVILSPRSPFRDGVVELGIVLEVGGHGRGPWLAASFDSLYLIGFPWAKLIVCLNSFPRSAWECRLRRSAALPRLSQDRGAVKTAFPRRAWERV